MSEKKIIARAKKAPIIRPGAHYIRITTVCNHNCVFCNVDRTVEAGPAQAAAAIAHIPPGACEVVVTGGEPAIDAALPKYLRAIRAATNAQVTLQTNGIVFYYKSFLEKLEQARLADRILVSFPSHEPEAYSRLTGGNFELLEGALDNLAESRFEVVLNYLINSENHNKIADFAHWLTGAYSNRFGVLFSTVIPAGRALANTGLMARHSDAAVQLGAAADTLARARVPFMIAGMYGMPPCILGPRLTAHSEMETYLNANCHAETGTDRFVRGHGCGECRYSNICAGVWDAYAEKFGVGELMPVRTRWQLPRFDPPPPADQAKRYVQTFTRMEKGQGLRGNFVVWSVTGRCNCKCEMCAGTKGARSLGDFLDERQTDAICADLKSLGFDRILLCGGEPTLFDGTATLIRQAKTHGIRVFMNTNGLLLKSRMDGYIAAGLDMCIMSLDSPDADVHDAIRGVRGLHAEVMDCAKRLAEFPGAARLHSVLMKKNIDTISGIVGLAHECGVRGLDFTFVVDEKGNDRSGLRPDFGQIRRFFLETLPRMAGKAADLGIRLHASPMPVEMIAAGEGMEAWAAALVKEANRPSLEAQFMAFAAGRYGEFYLRNRVCSACHRNVTIDFDGKVYPCAQSVAITSDCLIGDLKEKSMKSLWNSAAFRRFRVQAPKRPPCAGCFPHSIENEILDELLSAPQRFASPPARRK